MELQIKGLIDEDFVNYHKPSMFIIFPHCSFKCDKENNCNLCQNSHLAQVPIIKTSIEAIAERYIQNPLTKAIVIGGLEPFDSPEQLVSFIKHIRKLCIDDIVIYTGYTEEELQKNIFFKEIIKFPNIIIKYGRFRPNEEKHLDIILGVKLCSRNQYAKRYNYA